MPGGKKTVVGTALALVLGVSVSTAVDTMHDTRRNESSGKAHLCAYPDSVGIWTIGDGLIRYPDGRTVKRGDCITQKQADEYFEQEMVTHARPMVAGIPQLYGRGPQVRAALDITYNCGVGFVVNGAIGRSIRAGDWLAANRHIMDCSRGTFHKVPPSRIAHDCVKKRAGGFACIIPGLEARRRRNQVQFGRELPAQGTH